MASLYPAIIWRFIAHHDQIAIPLRELFRRKADQNRYFANDEIIADWPIVFAVWPEQSRPAAIGMLCIKGYAYGSSILPEAREMNSTAIWCGNVEEAIAKSTAAIEGAAPALGRRRDSNTR